MDKKITLSVDIAPLVGYQASVNLVNDHGAGEGFRIHGPSYAGNSHNLFETELTADTRAVLRRYLDVVDGNTKDEQLRELLSHCYVEAGRTDGGAADVYTEVGMRLKDILDGEK